MFKRLNIVIYGGGYIGTELYYRLRKLNHNVIYITRNQQDLTKPFDRSLIINEFEKLYQFSTNKFIFINCAAIAKTLYKDDSIKDINLSIVKNELNILNENDIFIQISSYHFKLNTPYGISKRICDEYILNSNIKANKYILRITYPFGCNYVLPNNGIISMIFRNQCLTLYNEALKVVNRYNYIGDITKILIKISNNEIDEKIIYCPGYDMSLESFINLYEKYNGTLFKVITSNPNYVHCEISEDNNWRGIEKTDLETMFYNPLS